MWMSGWPPSHLGRAGSGPWRERTRETWLAVKQKVTRATGDLSSSCPPEDKMHLVAV